MPWKIVFVFCSCFLATAAAEVAVAPPTLHLVCSQTDKLIDAEDCHGGWGQQNHGITKHNITNSGFDQRWCTGHQDRIRDIKNVMMVNLLRVASTHHQPTSIPPTHLFREDGLAPSSAPLATPSSPAAAARTRGPCGAA